MADASTRNQPIDAASQVFDGTKIDGPAGLRKWLLGYSDQFVEVVAEKLLTYALGRGVEYQDMPLVRSISRDAAKNDNRFSTLVLGVVKSKPFQMNMKVQDAPANNEYGIRKEGHITMYSSPRKHISRDGRFSAAPASRWRCRCSIR